jgi:hypothetical protein
MNAACGWTLIRKTSLLREINPMMRRSSFTKKDIYKLNHLAMIERRNVLEIMNGPANCFAGSKLGSISSIRCQKSRMRIRKDTTCEVMFRGRYLNAAFNQKSLSIFDNHLVEPDGIEPTTSCLQSTRSPS